MLEIHPLMGYHQSMSVIQTLSKKGVVTPLKWVPDNLIYEVQTGSVSYGASTESSDTDIVGIVMNPKSDFFPNQIGHVYGFGKPPNVFTTWQHHHAIDPEDNKEYDLTVYGLANWFTLLADNNPNMVDILFSPLFCVRVNTPIAQHIRTNRRLFLNKKSKHTFIGYAYAQLSKIAKKEKEGKRQAIIDKYGWDVKYGMHLVRLCYECEQILTEGDLDLLRHSAELKSIRNGEWKEQDVIDFFNQKESYLERLYQESPLPHAPDMDAIRELLLQCIEMHYGSLDKLIHIEGANDKILREIKALVEKAKL